MNWMTLFYVIFLYCLAVVVHEFGHMIILRILNKRWPVLRIVGWKHLITGYPSDYWNLTKQQGMIIYMTGIIVGMIPIALMPGIMPAIALVPYLVMGCRSDIKEILKLETKTKITTKENVKFVNELEAYEPGEEE